MVLDRHNLAINTTPSKYKHSQFGLPGKDYLTSFLRVLLNKLKPRLTDLTNRVQGSTLIPVFRHLQNIFETILYYIFSVCSLLFNSSLKVVTTNFPAPSPPFPPPWSICGIEWVLLAFTWICKWPRRCLGRK